MKNKKVPESFRTPIQAGAFWDFQDLGEFHGYTRRVRPYVKILDREYYLKLEPAIAKKLELASHRVGQPLQKLANRWLREKLTSRV